MGNLDNDTLSLKNSIIKGFNDTNELRKEMCDFKNGNPMYKPKYNFNEYYSNFLSRTDDKVLLDIIKHFNIEYVDETWQKSDWVVVFIAGSVGILLDILITQTKILKPVEGNISKFMKSAKVSNLKESLDNFSDSFRDGGSASIDYQGFKMFGSKSIHAQYSFGHDPLRFIEGIMQIMSGDYKGVDKLGNMVTEKFGERIPNIFHAAISYVAHMMSDFCNANGLPYPGTTLLTQFGSQKTRDCIAAAYRGQLYNSRTFVYQSLPALMMSIIIHCWAVYDNFTINKKINLTIGKSLKYQPMLLVANAMVMTSNLSITGIRGVLGDPHALFRANWPVILNTVKHSIKYLINENKRIAMNKKIIDQMFNESENNKLQEKEVSEYIESIDNEFRDFLKYNLDIEE